MKLSYERLFDRVTIFRHSLRQYKTILSKIPEDYILSESDNNRVVGLIVSFVLQIYRSNNLQLSVHQP